MASLLIKREPFIQKIRPFIGKDIVKILTGIRRCGKSVMLQLIREELIEQGVDKGHIIAMNFDTFENGSELNAEAVYFKVKKQAQAAGEKVYLFFDEIQELEGWEKLANSCLTELKADIYITGSNSKLLSGEYATYLSGRYVMFKVYPFSFNEVLTALAQTGTSGAVSPDSAISEQEAFEKYLVYGGMPFIYQSSFDDFSIQQYLRDVTDAIILKDITGRYNIRDVDQLKRLILYLFSNVGNLFSTGSVQNYLKSERRSLSWETIYNYIEYCKAAYLLLPALQEDLSGKSLLRVNEKIYFTDHGLWQALYGNNKRDIQQILENIVYLELLRHDYTVTIGKIGDKEIDFVAQKNNEKIYIQVAYLLSSPETIERKFAVFREVKDNYPKYVLSLDEFDLSREGIRHMNIRRFLTNGWK
ncbi:ATPase [Spirochaetia bacterium]|nr:ATPase [Spirochaetia bacterium]